MERKLYITINFDTEDFELAEASFEKVIDDLFNSLDNHINIGYEIVDMETK